MFAHVLPRPRVINDMIEFNGWFAYRFVRPQFFVFFFIAILTQLTPLTQKSYQNTNDRKSN